jgi:myo-inositol 2-dehydrogenase/D-chiro-inositol 1-dehydrogenase
LPGERAAIKLQNSESIYEIPKDVAMRVALVGLGDIGLSAHLPALIRHPAIDLVQLVDPDPDRRAAVTELGIPTVTELAPGADVDGVVLATPPWVTPELTVDCARAGLFVLAEKPVATSMETARVYDKLEPAERGRVQVGLTYRHDPAIAQLATWIANGTRPPSSTDHPSSTRERMCSTG